MEGGNWSPTAVNWAAAKCAVRASVCVTHVRVIITGRGRGGSVGDARRRSRLVSGGGSVRVNEPRARACENIMYSRVLGRLMCACSTCNTGMLRKENNEEKINSYQNDDDDNDSDNHSPRDITRALTFMLANQ